MFFTKYIKGNHFYNSLAILIINSMMIFLKLLRPRFKKVSDNIVVISLHRLGDTVLTIPALKKILSHHKQNIFLVCFEETVPIYKIVFNSFKFVALNENHFIQNSRHRIGNRKSRDLIKALNPKIIYDITGKITSVSLFFNSAAHEIVGCNDPYFRPIYTKYVPIRNKPPLSHIYIDAISPIIHESEFEKDTSRINNSGSYILIHPFASHPAKEWGINKYIQLAIYLNMKFPCYIVAQENQIQNDILKEINNKKIKVIETKSVSELIETTKNCFLFIGNDSGPAHIANLLGKPIFTIFGPTNPDFVKPSIGLNEHIIKMIKCSPRKADKECFTLGGLFCPVYDCMYNLSVEEVKIKLIEYLNIIKKT